MPTRGCFPGRLEWTCRRHSPLLDRVVLSAFAGVRLHGRFLLPGRRRADGHHLPRAGPIPEVIERSPDPALAARLAPRVGDPRLRVPRARAAGQRELYPVRGTRAAVRAMERVRRARAFAQAPAMVLPDRRLRELPRLLQREVDAREEAARLRGKGEDVWLSSMPAYSTLGYFDDPVLSTFVRWPETEVARMGLPRARAPSRVREGRHPVGRAVLPSPWKRRA